MTDDYGFDYGYQDAEVQQERPHAYALVGVLERPQSLLGRFGSVQLVRLELLEVLKVGEQLANALEQDGWNYSMVEECPQEADQEVAHQSRVEPAPG